MIDARVLQRLADLLRREGYGDVRADLDRGAVDLRDPATGLTYALVVREKPSPWGRGHRFLCPALSLDARPDDCTCGAATRRVGAAG